MIEWVYQNTRHIIVVHKNPLQITYFQMTNKSISISNKIYSHLTEM